VSHDSEFDSSEEEAEGEEENTCYATIDRRKWQRTKDSAFTSDDNNSDISRLSLYRFEQDA
jgi:hypothetical protein